MFKKFYLVLFSIAVLVATTKSVEAQITYTWSGGTSGAWNTTSNWKVGGVTPLVVPGSLANDVVVINTSNVTITYAGTLTNTIGSLSSSSYGVSGINISLNSGTSLTITNGLSMAQPSSFTTVIQFSGSGSASIGGTSTFAYGGSMTIGSGTTVNFTSSSTIDFTANQGVMTNNGTMNLTSCNFKLGSSSSFVSPGNFTATSSTLNITGTPAYITYGGKFYVTSCTFNIPSGGYFKCTSTSASFAGKNNTYNLTGSGGAAYIYNSGTYVDHNPTYNMTGQGAYLQNASGATMNLRGGTVTFSTGGGSNNQNIQNAGTLTADSSIVINVNTYTSYISNSGTFYAGTSGASASTCTINLAGQSGTVTNTNLFYLGPASIIYPTAYGALVNNSSGTFTIQSDINGTGAIGFVNANASCTGTFNTERYFQGGSSIVGGRYAYRGYRLISSPVHNSATYNGNNVYGLNYIVGATAGLTTTANSTTNAFITGCTGGSTSAGNPSMYLYKESVVPSNAGFTAGNYVGITNITNSSTTGTISTSDGTSNPSLPIGTGVLFFDRGQATNWSTRTKAPYIAPEPVTLTSTGLINQQSVTVKPWNNSSSSNLNYTITGSGTGSNTNYAVRGYNLVGNPYPCSIDWNTSWSGSGITATNLSATIWVFNERTNQYDTFTTSSSAPTTGTGNATNIIASGQGFLVKGGVIPANSSSLTFTENCKAPTKQLTATTTLLMGTPAAQAVAQTLRLNMVTDSINHDDIIIGFNSGASSKFSQMEDGQYIPGNGAAEGLSSISEDGYKLAINYMPLPKQTATSVKLFVTAAATGLYTMQRTQLDGIPAIYEVWLMDKYKKDSLDLRNNTTYAFNVDLTDTASYGNNRFEVLIRQNPALGIHLLQFTATKASSGSQVTWKTENEVNYTNFTVERSNDNGTTYNVIGGFVSTAAGTYGFLDSSPQNGANLYRLKIEDLNGTITYSNVVTLMYSGTTNNITINNIKVYPNPTGNTINLAITPPTSSVTSSLSALQSQGTNLSLAPTQSSSLSYGIKIIDITGSVIKTATSASASWQDNVSTLSPGTYIIQVVNNSNKSVVGKSTFVKL